MKKIIPSILLAASASSSLLLARDVNRKEEPQTIFPSKITTNYQLPTTNCNNQDNNLDCYLMMDPVTLGKGAEALEKELGHVEERCLSGKIPAVENAIASSPIGSSSSSVSSAFSSSSAMLSSFSSSSSATLKTGANTANTAPNNNSDQGSALKKQKIADSTKKSALGVDCQDFFNTIAGPNYANEALTRGADPEFVKSFEEYKKNAFTAYDSGDIPLAMGWIQLIEAIQQGVEYSINAQNEIKQYWGYEDPDLIALEIYKSNWYRAAHAINLSTCIRAELIKATELQKPKKIIDLLKESVKQSETCVNHWRGVAESSEKEEEKHSRYFWSVIQNNMMCLYKAALALQKKKDKIMPWEESAIQYQLSADYYGRLVEAYRGAPEKYNGSSTADPYEEEHKPLRTVARYTHNRASALFQVANALVQSDTARMEGKTLAAVEWEKVVIQRQKVADCYRIGVEDCEKGENLIKVTSFEQIADAINCSADWLSKAAAALEKIPLARTRSKEQVMTPWKKMANKYQEVANYYQECVAAYERGEYDQGKKGKNDYGVRQCADSSRKHLDLAVKCLEEAAILKTEGKIDEATAMEKMAEQHQKFYDYFLRFSESYKKESETDIKLCKEAIEDISLSKKYLEKSIETLKKTTNMKSQGKKIESTAWEKVAVQYQKMSDYFQQKAALHINRSESETSCHSFNDMDFTDMNELLNVLIEVANSQDEGNVAMAIIWEKAATQYQKYDDYMHGDDQFSSEAYEVAFAAQNSASSFSSAAEVLRKAIAANTEGNASKATAWETIFTQYQKAADCYRRAAEAYNNENGMDAKVFIEIGKAALSHAEILKQQLDVVLQTEGEAAIATVSEKIATQEQKSSDYYIKLVEGSDQESKLNVELEKAITAAKATSKENEAIGGDLPNFIFEDSDDEG